MQSYALNIVSDVTETVSIRSNETACRILSFDFERSLISNALMYTMQFSPS
ncbi:hypothetical protein ALC53_09440 [Atta colombica]|uniref:Uncharacterized protein n=1 Tax=Atta colombica TaxID=520822 RepID=A0A195B773_9HYME|nr:hypothetical protein ALC53_09440 [Atta colombica]